MVLSPPELQAFAASKLTHGYLKRTNNKAYCMVGGAVLLVLLLWRLAPLTLWRVRRLIRASHALCDGKDYDSALVTARAARRVARDWLGAASATHRRTLLHLATIQACVRAHDEALATLDEADALAAAGGAPVRVPLLWLRADVLEAADRAPSAIEALDAARVLCEASSTQRAMACFRQALLIVRHANDDPALDDARRAALVTRAAELALEASSASDAAFESHEGDELVEAILEAIVKGGSPNRLGELPGSQAAIHALQEHLRVAEEQYGGTEEQVAE